MLILDLLEVLFMPRLAAGRLVVVAWEFIRHVAGFDVSIAAALPGVRLGPPGFHGFHGFHDTPGTPGQAKLPYIAQSTSGRQSTLNPWGRQRVTAYCRAVVSL